MRILALVLMMVCGAALAADQPVTVVVKDVDVTRVRLAFGRGLNLGRPATLAEVQAWMARQMKEFVKSNDRAENIRAAAAQPVTDPDVQ